MKVLIVGGGGRESAFALKLSEDSEVFAVIPHKNPTIMECVAASGGACCIGDAGDPGVVADFAEKSKVDYVFVSADEPLANGVVDELLNRGIKAIGGTRAATRIEWDKIYSIEMTAKVAGEFTPFYKVVSRADELQSALQEFQDKGLEVVVKPQGLTGGKGVKVMPEHLSDYGACAEYAGSLLAGRSDERVLLVEKLRGIEFTIMGITDGEHLVLSPASYDYPFRLEGDRGAGTGGMGCFTDKDKKLPFINDSDLADCKEIMARIIQEMKERGDIFNGVLNGGFFKTRDGIRFMEFNGRFGDPEGLNILSILEGSFSRLLVQLWQKTLNQRSVDFKDQASVIKYLVAHEYPMPSSEAQVFEMDTDAIAGMGVQVFFASCERTGTGNNLYTTLKKSRVVAFGTLADSIVDASDRINEAIDSHVTGNLEYRRDIGSAESLAKLDDVQLSD